MKKIASKVKFVGNNVHLSRRCRVTGETTTVTVSEDDFCKWRGGFPLSMVCPHLNPDQRKMFFEHYTPKELAYIEEAKLDEQQE